jgi:hypothetical protein
MRRFIPSEIHDQWLEKVPVLTDQMYFTDPAE